MVRTIVIGDVHGCLVDFRKLVDAVRPGPSDRLVLVGDLLDRGPDPVGCVRLARQLGAQMVLGNHEEVHLRWRSHEERCAQIANYRNPMAPLGELEEARNADLSDEDIAWCQRRSDSRVNWSG